MVGDLLQPTHLLFVLVVALLVLGPKRLPEVGRSLGKGRRDFRHAMSGEDHDDEVLTQTAAQEPPTPAVETGDSVVEPVEPATKAAKPADPVGWASSRH